MSRLQSSSRFQTLRQGGIKLCLCFGTHTWFCICIFVFVFSPSLSPPPPRSECTAQQAQEATGGRCIFASGTGFADVEIDGKVIASSQCNNRCVGGTNSMALIGTFPWGSVNRICHAWFLPILFFCTSSQFSHSCISLYLRLRKILGL